MSRIIPTLLLQNRRLVKTRRFEDPRYLGDPLNTLKIFNAKKVDELILLDIGASREGDGPDFDYLKKIVSESFHPLAYGGGIRSIEDVRKVISLGVEKVVLNTKALEDFDFIREAVRVFGSQSIVVSIDIRNFQNVYIRAGTKKLNNSSLEVIRAVEEAGAGEILLHFIDCEGTYSGFNLDYISSITGQLRIPVIICGGMRDNQDFDNIFRETGVSAIAVGSRFVFCGSRESILVTYDNGRVAQTT